jgi:hypothetical protein
VKPYDAPGQACAVCGKPVRRDSGFYCAPVKTERRSGAGGFQGYVVGSWARHTACNTPSRGEP